MAKGRVNVEKTGNTKKITIDVEGQAFTKITGEDGKDPKVEERHRRPKRIRFKSPQTP